ncbi:MAG: lipoate--protein ligase family protein [Candidatus Omnitrophota bacterium]
MMTRWRVIETGALDPFANMALDEAILRGYQRLGSPPTLRVYGWQRPSLTLGYSQDPARDLDIEHCRKMSVPFVRRITGGGIILHASELTYSLICSKEDLRIPDGPIASSYRAICSFLISFYKALGIDARFACDDPKYKAHRGVSSLCFAAREKYDIVSGGRKIGGSAQKRSRGAVFQHGSIPLRPGPYKASSFLRSKTPMGCEGRPACLEDLLGTGVNEAGLSRALIEAFAGSFEVEMETSRLSGAEEDTFRELKALKYESDDWNYNRIDKVERKD